MRWWAATIVATAACGFNPQGRLAGDDDDDDLVDAEPTADGAIDARVIDAPIDAAAPICPIGYDVVGGASRYALRPGPVTVQAAATDCNDDLPGRTHLATFEGSDLDAVVTATTASTDDEIYLSAKCDTTSTVSCDLPSSWVWSPGGAAVAAGLWEIDEPFGELGFVYTQRRKGRWHLVSSAGAILRPYLCECEP